MPLPNEQPSAVQPLEVPLEWHVGPAVGTEWSPGAQQEVDRQVHLLLQQLARMGRPEQLALWELGLCACFDCRRQWVQVFQGRLVEYNNRLNRLQAAGGDAVLAPVAHPCAGMTEEQRYMYAFCSARAVQERQLMQQARRTELQQRQQQSEQERQMPHSPSVAGQATSPTAPAEAPRGGSQ